MTNKERLVLDIVKVGVLLYEVSFQAPKKYGRAIASLDDAFSKSFHPGFVSGTTIPRKPNFDTVEAITNPAHELAEQYLEWIYNGKDRPAWLEGYEYAE